MPNPQGNFNIFLVIGVLTASTLSRPPWAKPLLFDQPRQNAAPQDCRWDRNVACIEIAANGDFR